MRRRVIRPAADTDAEGIRHLVFEVLAEYGLRAEPDGTDADLKDIEAHYLATGGLFEVVEDGGRIVGTVGLVPAGDGVFELRKMYLAREARGRGLGKRLLERALAAARERGGRRVELETASCLVEAIGLYRRYGFQPVSGGNLASPRCDLAFALDLDPRQPT